SGQAANSAVWPSGVATSAATAVIIALVALRMSAAAGSSRSRLSPLSTASHPASASLCAQARPSPRLEAQTMALRPAMPRSMGRLLAPPEVVLWWGFGRAGQFLWRRGPALSTGVVERWLGVLVD